MEKKIIKLLKNPLYLIVFLNNRGIHLLNDEKYLKLLFKLQMNSALDLESPKTFNEKLQWLKLYDRKDEYTKMVDKYEAKEYVESIIGKQYIIPTLGVYDKFDEIDFDKLPNEFVIKCTHDSGGLIICRDKQKFDKLKAKKKISKCLKKDFYYANREWPYKNVKKRIIVEKYMEDKHSNDLKDYKLFCFNGKTKYILVCSNRQGSLKNTDFFDTNWNLMPFTRENHINNPKGIEKPKNISKMIEIANTLSKDIPFVRVDLYEINGKVYFGELTLFPSAGFEGFEPKEWDNTLGELIEIENIKKEKK